MRAVNPRSTALTTLHRDDHMRSAEIRHVVAGGLELRFMRDRTLTIWSLFRHGADLLNAAGVERFELEARGWQAETTAAPR